MDAPRLEPRPIPLTLLVRMIGLDDPDAWGRPLPPATLAWVRAQWPQLAAALAQTAETGR